MKFLLRIILIGVLTYAFEQILPWWSISIAAFTGGFIIKTKSLNSFLAGALGVGLVWLWIAYRTDLATNSILTVKMAMLLKLENNNLLIIITALLGSTIGAFSSWTGHNLRSIFVRTRKRTGYYN